MRTIDFLATNENYFLNDYILTLFGFIILEIDFFERTPAIQHSRLNN